MKLRAGIFLTVLALGAIGAGCGQEQRPKQSVETGAAGNAPSTAPKADDGQPPAPKPDEKPKADPAKPAEGAAMTVDEHSFTLPAAWKKGEPSNAMRKFQADVAKSAGDADNAEFVVSKAGGGVDANIKRWAGQFGGETALKNKYEVKTAGGVTATVAELEGSYAAMTMGGVQPAKDNYKQLGAILSTPSGDYFLKLTGPKKTVDENKAAFDALLASFK
jgi:hypothetical protein